MVHIKWIASSSARYVYRSIRQWTPHAKLRRYRNSYLVAAFSFFLATTFVPFAHASRGGEIQTTNTFSIGYIYNSNNETFVCSGTLISPTVILTAAHCILDRQQQAGTNYTFSDPGDHLDDPIDPANPPPTPTKFVLFPGYKTTGSNEENDIAFIITNKAFPAKIFIPIATKAEIDSLNNSSTIYGYGYGHVYETNESYSPLPRRYDLTWENHVADEPANNMIRIGSRNDIACIGDSGGPITAIINGTEKLIGALSGILNNQGSYCGMQGPDGFYYQHIIYAYPYLNLIESYLAQEAAAAAKKATLTPTPTPTTSAKSTATKTKTITITCVKGKTIKKVSGTAPKCPSGYKKV